MDFVYETEMVCPVCGKKVRGASFRWSQMRLKQRETDYRQIFEDVEPLYNFINYCTECHYAGPENQFERMTDKQVKTLKEFLEAQKVFPVVEPDPLKRTPDMVEKLFGQAIACMQMRGVSYSALAGVILRLAWFYRVQGKTEKEQKFLSLAYQAYEKVYTQENLPVGKMTSAMVSYLLGELARRVGMYKEAARWFMTTLNDRGAKDPELERNTREQLSVTKTQLTQLSGTAST